MINHISKNLCFQNEIGAYNRTDFTNPVYLAETQPALSLYAQFAGVSFLLGRKIFSKLTSKFITYVSNKLFHLLRCGR